MPPRAPPAPKDAPPADNSDVPGDEERFQNDPRDEDGSQTGSHASRAARRAKERAASRASSPDGAGGSDDDDAASYVSSASSSGGDNAERLRVAIGEPEEGRAHVEDSQFLSWAWNAMLDKGLKDKKLSEDDRAAANTIVGLIRKALHVQDIMRADGYAPTDIHEIFRQELEAACRWIAWIQFRAELPSAAAKTAYATVVAKRDRRSFKATKSGVVFVFDEQAKIYESYSKALLKAETSGNSKAASDQDRALDGKASAASATKALSEAKKELAKIKKEKEGLQRRNRTIEDAARQGGVSLPAGQARERAANRTRTRSTTAAGNGAAQE